MIFSIILLYCFGNLKAQEEEKGNYKDLAEALQNPKEVRILDLNENRLILSQRNRAIKKSQTAQPKKQYCFDTSKE